MIEQTFLKLLGILVEPVQLIMLLWIAILHYDKFYLNKINTQLLTVQQERGLILQKITIMIETLMRGDKK